MERESDAYKLSRCMCRSNYYRFWDTARYLWKNRHFMIPPVHSTPPLGGGVPSEYRHLLWDDKTRMVSLPDGEKISKICLFVLTWSTNVTDGRTDGQTDTAWQQRPRLCIASRGKNATYVLIVLIFCELSVFHLKHSVTSSHIKAINCWLVYIVIRKYKQRINL